MPPNAASRYALQDTQRRRVRDRRQPDRGGGRCFGNRTKGRAVLHGGPARCGGAREPAEGNLGVKEFGIRHTADKDHDQPGSGGSEKRRVGVRFADRDGDHRRVRRIDEGGRERLPAGGRAVAGWDGASGAGNAADRGGGAAEQGEEPAGTGGERERSGGGERDQRAAGEVDDAGGKAVQQRQRDHAGEA